MKKDEEATLLSRALRCLHDAVALVDLHRNVVFANPALEELVGVPRGGLTGKPVEDILVSPEDRDGKRPPLSLAGETSRSGRLLHANGSEIPVRWRAILVSSPETGLFSTFTFRDLRPEIRARRTEERLRHSERLTLLGQFFGGVAHEVRNPLGHIMLSAELLGSEPDPRERRALVRSIVGSAERCAKILEDALSVVRKDKGKSELQSLFEPIREIVDLVRKPFSHDSIEVQVEIEDEVPPVPVDRGKVQQILINLLHNARDALLETRGGGSISVRLSSPPERDGALLEVLDDGPGVAPEILDRIGEAFFTTKEDGKGTGLGLSICQTLVEEFGGDLSVRNGPSGGALARVFFPIRPPTPKEDAPRPGQHAVQNLLEGKRVLLVDDDADCLEALRRCMVSLATSRVDLARSAGEALAHLRASEYDLVLCDIRLPAMSGLTLHQIVHIAFPPMADRFLFLSGFTDAPRAQSYFSDRPLKRLGKPYQLEELQEAILAVLAQESSQKKFPAPFTGQPRWF